MSKRIPREWAWVPLLIAVLVLSLFGCTTNYPTEKQRQEAYVVGREEYYAEHFIEIEYKGHTYIYYSRWERMGLTHAAHCKARHR